MRSLPVISFTKGCYNNVYYFVSKSTFSVITKKFTCGHRTVETTFSKFQICHVPSIRLYVRCHIYQRRNYQSEAFNSLVSCTIPFRGQSAHGRFTAVLYSFHYLIINLTPRVSKLQLAACSDAAWRMF